MAGTVIASKKKKGTAKLIVGAVASGILAAGFTYLYITIRENELIQALAEKQGRKVAVVVAKSNLPQGTPISGQTMAVREIPAELAYPDVVTPDEFAAYQGLVLGKPLGAGTPLLKTFVQQDVARDFSDTIPLGRRAMTIQVDEIASQSGLMRPGNHVDIYTRLPAGTRLSATGGDTNIAPVVLPLLQDIQVLATGRDSAADYQAKYIEPGRSNNPFNFTAITVDVSPREAALLAAAQEKGELIALLRNRKDNGGATFKEIYPADMWAYTEQKAEEAQLKEAANALDAVHELADGDLIVKNGVVMTKDGKVMKDLIVQPDGTVTTRDGKVVMSADGKMTKGVLLTKDGKVINNPNLTVKDGVLMTKDGVVLSGRGLTVNENGQIVTKDGKVIDPADLIVTKDGKVMTKDGTVLGDTDVVMGRDGKALNPNDVRVTKDGFIVTKDGTVMTKDGVLLKGVTVGADGKVRAADGTVITAQDVSVSADGSVAVTTTKAVAGVKTEQRYSAEEVQQQLAAGTLKRTKDGFLVAADGTVMTKDGKVLSGVTLNAQGEVVSADGTVLKADALVINADGTVGQRTAVAGVSAQKRLTADEIASQLASGKLTRTKDGFLVAADGTMLTADGTPLNRLSADEIAKQLAAGTLTRTKDGFLVSADGTVMTKDGTPLSGVKVNAQGEVVSADGTVLKADDLVVNADGSVSTRDGQAIEGVGIEQVPTTPGQMKQLLAKGITERSDGLLVAADGTVMTKDGKILKGLTVGADGKLRTADGTEVDGTELVYNTDGSVSTKEGKKLAGVSLDSDSEQAKLMQEVLKVREGASVTPETYELILGGSSKDGRPLISDVPYDR